MSKEMLKEPNCHLKNLRNRRLLPNLRITIKIQAVIIAKMTKNLKNFIHRLAKMS
jgi:hypothetical protein